jgi:uncharacterized protein YndB with AHSA1/START domain
MTGTQAQNQVIHSTFTIERTYRVAPAKVFDAFANPAKKRRWFAEGEGFEVVRFDSDFRVGGKEICDFKVLRGPIEGTLIQNETNFLDIIPEKRIVVAYTMSMKGKPFSASLATTELKPGEDGKSTKLVFTEQGAYFEGSDGPKMREHGTRELLDALEQELARAE